VVALFVSLRIIRLRQMAAIYRQAFGVDIRFLDKIFGFAIITQDAAGHPVKSAIVPLHDGVECRGVRAIAARGASARSGHDHEQVHDLSRPNR
jgi:hypothetical protein